MTLLRDLRDAARFMALTNVSLVTGQIFRIVLLNVSDQSRYVLVLEALRNPDMVDVLVPEVLRRLRHAGEDQDCDGDCEHCTESDEHIPGDDDVIH